jgi:hypothetical protein
MPGLVAAVLLATLLAACGQSSAQCVDVPLSEAASAALASAEGELDFEPQLPCAFGRGFLLTSVLVDRVQGGQPRISFLVQRHGERAFVLSQTRAEMRFTAIPQGTHRLRVAAPGVVTDGFAGPSGTGTDSAFRWRVDGITFELDALLGRRLSGREFRQLAEGMMRAGPE